MELKNVRLYQDRLAREGGEVIFGLTLDASVPEWTAWNNTYFSEEPFCALPTRKECVEYIRSKHPGRETIEHGSFAIVQAWDA